MKPVNIRTSLETSWN